MTLGNAYFFVLLLKVIIVITKLNARSMLFISFHLPYLYFFTEFYLLDKCFTILLNTLTAFAALLLYRVREYIFTFIKNFNTCMR